MTTLRITWDDGAKVGYLYLCDEGRRTVAKTAEVREDSRFLLDLDGNGRVLGIEFLSDVPVSELMRWAHRYATKVNGQIITDW